MNDKEKQIEIEKMQQEIFDSCAWRFSRHPEDYREVANDIGEDLYNLGYRNCKDKVVLSMEEYKSLTNELDKGDYGEFESGYAQARKETAREILTELKNTRFHKGTLTYDFEMAVIRLAKQYGVTGEEV